MLESFRCPDLNNDSPTVYILDDKRSIRVVMARLLRAGGFLPVMMSDIYPDTGRIAEAGVFSKTRLCHCRRAYAGRKRLDSPRTTMEIVTLN